MTDRELLELVEEGMKVNAPDSPEYIVCAALRARLAQPEPVIYARKEGDLIVVDLPQVPTGGGGISKDEQPELTRKWVGLTDMEKFEIQNLKWWDWEDTFDLDGYTRAIEAKLKEKNT